MSKRIVSPAVDKLLNRLDFCSESALPTCLASAVPAAARKAEVCLCAAWLVATWTQLPPQGEPKMETMFPFRVPLKPQISFPLIGDVVGWLGGVPVVVSHLPSTRTRGSVPPKPPIQGFLLFAKDPGFRGGPFGSENNEPEQWVALIWLSTSPKTGHRSVASGVPQPGHECHCHGELIEGQAAVAVPVAELHTGKGHVSQVPQFVISYVHM